MIKNFVKGMVIGLVLATAVHYYNIDRLTYLAIITLGLPTTVVALYHKEM